MKNHLKFLGATCLGIAFAGYVQAQQLTGADVGTPAIAGSVTPNGDGTTTITGGGNDIWNNSDNFYYYSIPVTDLAWDAVVRVQDLQGPDGWTKVALMVRQASGAAQGNDPHISIVSTRAAGQNEIRGGLRVTRGGGSDGFNPNPVIRPSYPNQWLRVHRLGSLFTLYIGTDGVAWTKLTDIDTAKTDFVGSDAKSTFGNAWPNAARIGIAVTGHNDADVGTAIISDWKFTVDNAAIQAPTAVTFTKQPATASVYDGTSILLSVAATNNAVPNVVPMAYQWYKNGVIISNATAATYTYKGILAESGVKFTCKGTTPPYNATQTSAEGIITVLPGVVLTNGFKSEVFKNVSRVQVEQGTAGLPSEVALLSGFEAPVNTGGDNFVRRISGYFTPAATGNYTFIIASDDDADLFLSTDSSPANKVMIAQETGWCASRNWITGGNATQKRSDTFSLDGTTFPGATGYALTAGQKYYIEAVQHQGGGGVNLAVTYFTVGGTEPLDGDAPMLQATNANASLITSPSTNFVISTQPVNTKVFDQQNVIFNVKVTTDSEFTPVIQWYKNDQAVAGATATTWKFLSNVGTDNAAKIYAVVQDPGTSLVRTSTIVTLTVQQAVFEAGLLKREMYPGATRPTVEAGTAAEPLYTTTSYGWDAPQGQGNDYAQRMSGLFVPPTTGAYVFFIASDDDCDLYLSTDSTPANKRMIAQELGWSGNHNWLTSGSTDAGHTESKRSDQWPGPNNDVPGVFGYNLVAGQKYYIEGVMHQGGGGDNFAVTFKKYGEEDPANGTATLIKGALVGFNAPAATYMAFLEQPTNVTANSGQKVTLSAKGTSDSVISIGDNTNNLVMYQWYKNGTLIPDAVKSTFTTPMLLNSDDGSKYVCAIRALGMPTWSNSVEAVVTVLPDSTLPTITFVSFRTNDNIIPSAPVVDITFSKMMDLATMMQVARYTVPGASIVSMTINSNNLRQVELTLSGTPTLPLTISVTGLKDYTGNTIAPNSTATAHVPALINKDIGVSGDPAFPGFMLPSGTNSYTIICEGSDIWANADGFNFSYEMKTNDFDVVVRQVTTTHTSNWAKGGLMLRETLDPTSRTWNIVNDPASADGIPAPDGSGNGANAVESNCRDTTVPAAGGNNSRGWAFAPARVPAYPNAWVRLKRVGQELSSYASTNGVSWTMLGTNNPTKVGSSNALPSVLYVGICATAHNNDAWDATTLRFLFTAEFADYNSNYVEQSPAATLAAKIVGSDIVISWTGSGHLESSPAVGVGASWSSAGTTSPVTVPMTGKGLFFRLVNP